MAGATWNDRQPTDWLASNGKWYASSSYPRGWDSTALPPAPGHGGVTSILKKYTKAVTDVQSDFMDRLGGPESDGAEYRSYDAFGNYEDDEQYEYEDDFVLHEEPPRREPPRTKTPPPPSSERPAPPTGFSVAKSGRTVAPATVTAQRDYAEKLGSGTLPPPSLGAGDTPPPPGRLSPPSPPGVPAPPAPPKPPTPARAVEPAPAPQTPNLEVLAGDLGKVLGSARKKIEKALNDSYEGQ